MQGTRRAQDLGVKKCQQKRLRSPEIQSKWMKWHGKVRWNPKRINIQCTPISIHGKQQPTVALGVLAVRMLGWHPTCSISFSASPSSASFSWPVSSGFQWSLPKKNIIKDDGLAVENIIKKWWFSIVWDGWNLLKPVETCWNLLKPVETILSRGRSRPAIAMPRATHRCVQLHRDPSGGWYGPPPHRQFLTGIPAVGIDGFPVENQWKTAMELVSNVKPALINPRLLIKGGYHFTSQLRLFGGSTIINQPGFINPGLTLLVSRSWLFWIILIIYIYINNEWLDSPVENRLLPGISISRAWRTDNPSTRIPSTRIHPATLRFLKPASRLTLSHIHLGRFVFRSAVVPSGNDGESTFTFHNLKK